MSLSFDGVDDYAEFGDILRFEGRAPFSVAFWAFDWGFTGKGERIVSKDKTVAPREGWCVRRFATSNIYALERWQAGAVTGAGVTYTPNQWNFIALTYDGSVMRSFLNAASIASLSSALEIQPTTTPLRLGRISDGAEYFRGVLDEVRIYNRALSPDEIQDLYRGKNIVDGLVLFIDPSRPSGSRVFVPDWSGSMNHGRLHGGMSYPVLRTGGLEFDGVDDYVTIPHSPSQLIREQLTLSSWVYPRSIVMDVGATSRRVIQKGIVERFSFAFADTIMFRLVIAGVVITRFTGSVMTLDEWQYLTATYDGSHMRVYRNGVLVGEWAQTGLIDTTTTDLLVGTRSIPAVDGRVTGILDEVCIFNRALSPKEISDIYLGKRISNGLVMRLPFHEGIGTVAHDVSEFGNHGTIYGARWVNKKVAR